MSKEEEIIYDQLCRLCASCDGFKLDILSDEGRQRRLVDKITACLPIEVSQDDMYPKSLCYRCIYKVETFYEFRRDCIAAQAKLETVIRRDNEKILKDNVESNDVAGKVSGFSTNHLQTVVKVERNIEEEEENQTESEPPNKKLEIEYPCDRCEATFTSGSEVAEHCRSAHKDDSNSTSVLESVLSEGIKQDVDILVESGKENGINNVRTEPDEQQLGLMPDTSDKSLVKPIGKIKTLRKVYGNDDTPSKCEMCDKELPGKRHLWQHLIRYHRAEATTSCGVCLKFCASYVRLSVHLVIEHPDVFEGVRTKFVCKVCGKYHNARSKLLDHASVHGTEEERAQASYHCCLICESTFSDFKQLASHIQVEHKKEACNTPVLILGPLPISEIPTQVEQEMCS